MATTPRQFTPEFKAQVVLELLTQARSAAEICRTHQLKDSLLYRWKQEFLERALALSPLPSQARPPAMPNASPSWSGWWGV